jgi:O-antigen/teichoic acid export membrane protein
MMGGFYKIPSLILGFHKKVWFYPLLSAFAFGINALLNWYLIPLYGIIGAGFASFVGLFIYSVVMQILSFKYMSKRYIILISVGYIGILFFTLIVFDLEGVLK